MSVTKFAAKPLQCLTIGVPSEGAINNITL